MGFHTDWANFPDRKHQLFDLAQNIKDNAKTTTGKGLAVDVDQMISCLSREYLETKDDKIITAIKSALIELGNAAQKNKNYCDALTKSHVNIPGVDDSCVARYIALCMLVFKNHSEITQLNDIVKYLKSVKDINIEDVIQAQQDFYGVRELELSVKAKKFQESKNK